MAEEVKRVETVEERPRDNVVVRDRRTNPLWVILGVILILLVLFWLFGNPFTDDDAINPDVNVPNEVNIDVPSPDVNLPDVNVNETPNEAESTQPAQ